ncbi:MAG: FAD-dependent urate hydroxylase HpxO [Cyanobacteria bacterium J06639_1]
MDDASVIIIGAGIGGLTAGIALTQAGYSVEIYDRVSELRPVGAGISLWSNGVKVLNALGLTRQMADIGGSMERMQYLSATGTLLNDIDLQPLVAQVGQCPYPVARADLQQMLLDAFPGQVHLNAKCIGVDQTEDKAIAAFADGRQATADILIGADGIRSTVREYVLEEAIAPRYAGYVNVNGLVPASSELADARTWVIYVGDHKRASMMPVGGDRFYFFFDLPLPEAAPPHPDGVRAELETAFAGWCQPVQNLIAAIAPDTANRLPIRDVGPLERFARGRVVLLGDAAHTTTPDLGQGGCQATEDAIVLARCLKAHLSVTDALKQYEADRVPRTGKLVLKARQRTDDIHGKDPAVTQKWYEQLASEPPEAVTGAIAKVILGGPLH